MVLSIMVEFSKKQKTDNSPISVIEGKREVMDSGKVEESQMGIHVSQ